MSEPGKCPRVVAVQGAWNRAEELLDMRMPMKPCGDSPNGITPIGASTASNVSQTQHRMRLHRQARSKSGGMVFWRLSGGLRTPEALPGLPGYILGGTITPADLR
jgi:hypothetical protein